MSSVPEVPDAVLVRSLVQSIAKDPWPAPTADPPLLEEVVASLERIRVALFPRVASGHPNTAIELEAFVHRQVTDLRPRLYRQLVASFASAASPDDHASPVQRGADAINAFLSRIAEIRALLTVDAQAAYDGDPAARSIDEIILCYPGFYALTVHRMAHALHLLGVPLLPRMMSEWSHRATGIDIHPGATIGKGFFIDHGTGVVIGETVTIGEFCKVYQGVTLGAKSFEKDESGKLRKDYKRHPTLEDHVTVYAGATILGGDTIIGRGSVIAGGVFVTQSVPANHLAAQPRAELRVLDRSGL
jgi:serine O-acetyltransferase